MLQPVRFYRQYARELPSVACFNQLLTAVAATPRIVITESDIDDYPGMFLSRSGQALRGVFAPVLMAGRLTGGEFPQLIVTRRADFIARTAGQRVFPWRVLVIGTDRTLPATDLVYRLAAPGQLTDVSWVHPGKCTDEWITSINLFKTRFFSPNQSLYHPFRLV